MGAFLCLVVADFKAFREFGILAACGMAFTLLGYLTALPVLLGLLTRLRPGKPAPEAPPLALARPIVKYAKPIFAAMTLLLVFAMTRLPSARFNYDFAALDEGLRAQPTGRRSPSARARRLVVLPRRDPSAT